MIDTHAEQPALKDGNGNNLTYTEMKDRIATIAATLVESGATDGTPVGVFQSPSSDWICSMLAIFRVGATYVPLDLRSFIVRIASIVEIAKPVVLLTDHDTTGHVAQINARDLIEIVVADIATSASLPVTANQARLESQAVILFTSGTTGKPKGVILTHANIRAQCEATLAWLICLP
jgi:hybrid polyketide synthase/nonribosomal peptide synthetase ACE1